MKIGCLFLSLFSFSVAHAAEETDSLFRLRSEQTLPLLHAATVVADNPAMRHLHALPSQLKATLSHDRRKTTHADFFSPYEGSRQHTTTLAVDGLVRHLPKGTTATAFARYHRSQLREQQWTNVADVTLFYPYLTADTLVGTLYTERYSVGATWSKSLRAWTLGAGGSFRGEHNFRKQDPRADNTSSWLTLQVGSSYALSKAQVGLSIATDWYKQSVSVSSLEDNRKDYFFSFVGFGLYDRKFTDAVSSYARYYDRRAYRIAAQYAPLTASGFTGNIALEWANSEVEEDQVRKPYRRADRSTQATLLYTHTFAPHRRWQLGGKWRHDTWRGTEVQYDTYVVSQTPYITSYQPIYEAQKFLSQHSRATLFTYYEHEIATAWTAWGRYAATYDRQRETYAAPLYFLRTTTLVHDAAVGLRHFSPHHIYGLEVGYVQKNVLHHSASLPDRKNAFPQAAERLYAFRSLPWKGVQLSATYDYRLNARQQLSLALSFTHAQPTAVAGRHTWSFSTSWHF